MMAPLETTQETKMFDDDFIFDDDFFIPEDDVELASEENDSKLEFANELLQDYSFDNQ